LGDDLVAAGRRRLASFSADKTRSRFVEVLGAVAEGRRRPG
jgi:hypothetical protein